MNDSQRVAILTHKKFPDRAKTATGILKYTNYSVVAVLDHDNPGTTTANHRRDLPDMSVVASMVDVPDTDAFLADVSPIGDAFDETWHDGIRTALEYGCGLISDFHYFPVGGGGFTRLADGYGYDINGVHKPYDDLGVAQERSTDVDTEVILTVGIDCSVGRMAATFELVKAARERGIGTGFIPTDQTGIMTVGWGNPVSRVINDFTAGVVEEMILKKGDRHDVLSAEDQGGIIHPAYSAITCGILRDAMADELVLCHEATCGTIHGHEGFTLPDLSEYASLYESLADPAHEADVVAGMLNTSHVSDDVKAAKAVDAFTDKLSILAVGPVRFGSANLIDGVFQALTAEFESVLTSPAEPFDIAHGIQAEAENVVVRIEDEDGMTDVGATAPSSRYDETTGAVEAVLPDLLSVVEAVRDAYVIDRIEHGTVETIYRNLAM